MLCLGRDELAVTNDGDVNAAAYPRSREDDDVASKRGMNRPLQHRNYISGKDMLMYGDVV